MATFKRFEDMSAWQKARELTRGIYKASAVGVFSKDFGLRDQLRRAAISVMANIAEGFDRGGTKEFIQFLSTAKGSASEIKSHLYVALDQGYVDQANFTHMYEMADEIGKMLRGLMEYLRRTPLKGSKYKKQPS